MSALVFTLVANPKTVKAKGYEINGGIAGRVSHLQRVLEATGRSRARRRLERIVRPLLGLHRCEQPSSWFVRGTYQGGLGIYSGTWDAARPWWYPSEAYLATPAEQVAVAYRIAGRWGWSAWGGARCAGLA